MQVRAEGSIKIKITDEQLNENNQTFELFAEKGKILVNSLGNKKPDVEMTIEGLTALVYGFLTANDLEVFNWIKNANEKNIALLNSFFPLLKPILTEGF